MDAESPVYDELQIPWPEVRAVLYEHNRPYTLIKDQDGERFIRRLNRFVQENPDYRILLLQTHRSRRWLRPVVWYVAILLPTTPPVESDALSFDWGPASEQIL